MKFLTPILFIALAIGIFILLINPQYEETKILDAKIQSNNEMIILANKLRDEQGKLQQKYTSISELSRENLKKVLPDTVDNVRLVLDIDNIAQEFNIVISNIGVDVPENTGARSQQTNTTSGNQTDTNYGTIQLRFSFTTDYEKFKMFIKKIEDSLRLVDIVKIEVSPSSSQGAQSLFNYSLTINTYWLR